MGSVWNAGMVVLAAPLGCAPRGAEPGDGGDRLVVHSAPTAGAGTGILVKALDDCPGSDRPPTGLLLDDWRRLPVFMERHIRIKMDAHICCLMDRYIRIKMDSAYM
jgi:hypothetical protein